MVKVNKYVNKLQEVKTKLDSSRYNDLIDWNTAALRIYDDYNFHGDICISLKRNITINEMYNLNSSIKEILKESKAGLYIEFDESLLAENINSDLYFDDEEAPEIIFYNKYLHEHSEDYFISETLKSFRDANKTINKPVQTIQLDKLQDNNPKEKNSISFNSESDLQSLQEALDKINKETKAKYNIEYMLMGNSIIDINYKYKSTILICQIDEIERFYFETESEDICLVLKLKNKNNEYEIDTWFLGIHGTEC